jgi:predicted nucleotidyltransferase
MLNYVQVIAMEIEFDSNRLRDLCEQHGVRQLRFFGSVLTDRFDTRSDIDVLVEFVSEESPSLFELGRLQQDLSDLFGRTVDLKTPGFFDDSTLESILESSSVQYDRAA